MRRTKRTALVAIPFACLLAVLLFRPAHRDTPPVSPDGPARRVTVEPGLPLRIDLKVHDNRQGQGNQAMVEAVIDATAELREVSLRWVFPDGVRQDAGEAASPAGGRLRSGERRVVNVPVRASRQADLPIRLEASFQVADGRWFRTEQGILWRRRSTAPEGRHHAGAFEVYGVPVAEPLP